MYKPRGYTILSILTVIGTIGLGILLVIVLLSAVQLSDEFLGALWVVILLAVIFVILSWMGLSGLKKGKSSWAVFFMVFGILGLITAVNNFDIVNLATSFLYILGGYQANKDLRSRNIN